MNDEKLICPKCGSENVELNDEWCDMLDFYCDDCAHTWKIYSVEE